METLCHADDANGNLPISQRSALRQRVGFEQSESSTRAAAFVIEAALKPAPPILPKLPQSRESAPPQKQEA